MNLFDQHTGAFLKKNLPAAQIVNTASVIKIFFVVHLFFFRAEAINVLPSREKVLLSFSVVDNVRYQEIISQCQCIERRFQSY